MAAFNCGMDALMLGNLMMFASGRLASSPNSARASFTRWASGRRSLKAARMRPAKLMSRVSNCTFARLANEVTMGRNEYVANAGASSVFV